MIASFRPSPLTKESRRASRRRDSSPTPHAVRRTDTRCASRLTEYHWTCPRWGIAGKGVRRAVAVTGREVVAPEQRMAARGGARRVLERLL